MRYVYFISGNGHTKVGSSSSPERRLSAANVWSPHPLRLVAAVDGGFALERAVLEILADRHVRGEWFVGEVSHDDAVAIIARARLQRPGGVSASEMWPRPVCVCHGETMWWAKAANRRGGGYWRCAVKMKKAAAARKPPNRDHVIEGLYVPPSTE